MIRVNGKYIIDVDVPSGMQRPYCLKIQGMLDGVYLRVAGTTRRSARYQIQEMILDAGNRSFGQQRVERGLSEQEMEQVCQKKKSFALREWSRISCQTV